MRSYFLFIAYYLAGSKMGTEKKSNVGISALDVESSYQISSYFVVFDPSYAKVTRDFN
jgi:hypothetical protein